MPGRPEFLQAVGGQSGDAIQTNSTGVIETDNYQDGDGFDTEAYPVTLDPDAWIQELVLTMTGPGVVLDITTSNGTQFLLPMNGASGTFDKWEIDTVTITDPTGQGGRTTGGWAGE